MSSVSRWAVPAFGMSVVVLAACAEPQKRQGDAPAAVEAPAVDAKNAAPLALPTAAPVTRARAVIRDARVDLVTDAPRTRAASLTTLIEGKGGFVQSTEVSGEGGARELVKVVARVPSVHFAVVLEAIRKEGTPAREVVSGKDVTDELVDLDARLVADRAVEAQYLRILEQAKTVADLLEVQKKLGEVRVEIERKEGKKRLLEDQVAFSTFHVQLTKQDDVGAVASSDSFGSSWQAAKRDAAAGLRGGVHFAIRAVGVFFPIAVFLSVPGLIAFLAMRLTRRRPAPPAPQPDAG